MNYVDVIKGMIECDAIKTLISERDKGEGAG